MPKFVACEPRWWLWDDDEWHVDEEGLLTWPYELEGAKNLPSTLEKQELKRLFEEHAGPEYPRLTYEEHSRCGRGRFRIAKEGLPANEYWKAAERIMKEWDVLRESLNPRLDQDWRRKVERQI